MKGRTAPNKIIFSEEQILKILLDNRPMLEIGKDLLVSKTVIRRIKNDHKLKILTN